MFKRFEIRCNCKVGVINKLSKNVLSKKSSYAENVDSIITIAAHTIGVYLMYVTVIILESIQHH